MLAPSNSHSKSNVSQQDAAESKTYKFRCPSCQKLYAAEADKLKGSRAEFECIQCYKHFAFNLPAGGYSTVPTFLIEAPTPKMAPAQPEQIITTQASEVHGHTECPKCGATNSSRDSECWRCQVVLAKVKDLPLEMGRKVSPAVVSLWKQVLSGVDRPSLHQIFLKECERRHQLEYAIDRYTQLVEAQPHDKELITYLRDAQNRQARLSLQQQKQSQVGQRKIPTKKILIFAPIFISLVLILLGLSYITMRNLVGLGAAILVLYGGALLLISMPQKKPETWVSQVQKR